MGDIADHYLDKEIERMTKVGDGWGLQDHPLDNDYWVAKDNRKLYPARGDMDESHIRNVMSLIRKPNTIEVFQAMEISQYLSWPEPHGDGACDAFDLEFDDAMEISEVGHGSYFNRRIRNSPLWLALRKGLAYHYDLKQKANELNKGVLEL